MSTIIKSGDTQGIFGPAMCLISHSGTLSKEDLCAVSQLLEDNFNKLAHYKPEGRTEFHEFVATKGEAITAAEIVGTRFFQSMAKNKEEAPLAQKLQEQLLPAMLKYYQEKENVTEIAEDPAVKEWSALALHTYCTVEQLEQRCQQYATTSEKFKDTRTKAGEAFYEAITKKGVTEKDLDSVIEVCRLALKITEQSKNSKEVMKVMKNYLELFSVDNTPAATCNQVLDALSTTFREKHFPKQ